MFFLAIRGFPLLSGPRIAKPRIMRAACISQTFCGLHMIMLWYNYLLRFALDKSSWLKLSSRVNRIELELSEFFLKLSKTKNHSSWLFLATFLVKYTITLRNYYYSMLSLFLQLYFSFWANLTHIFTYSGVCLGKKL